MSGAGKGDSVLRGQDLMVRGQEALETGEWAVASACFEGALLQAQTAEALDGLAQALFGQEQYARALELRERAYAEYQRRGDALKASAIARWLCLVYFVVHDNLPVALGWMARAEQLVSEVGDCGERGWLTLMRAGLLPDPAARAKGAIEAVAVARRFGDRDLEFEALSYLGEALVCSGRIEEGMRRLDEAMAAATGGDVHGYDVIGMIYCKLLAACDHAGDFKRAEQWMTVVDDFVSRYNLRGVSAICRTCYGGILMVVGRWEEAERELLSALGVCEVNFRGLRPRALVRLADLRIRQGRLEEAEQLLDGIEEEPDALRPVIALHLARGEVERARSLVERYLAHQQEPDVFAAPVMALGVEIQLARGDLAAAQSLAAALRRIVETTGNQQARALAELALGRISLAAHEDGAVRQLERALLAFAEIEMPLEQARARVELARALAAESPEAAVAEARLAMAAFQRLAASRDADSAAHLLRELGVAGRAWAKGFGTLTGRELEVLRLLGAGFTNQQIAGRLYLSRRTVEHHVSNILSKLGLASRTEGAAYAVRHLVETPGTK